MIVKNLSSREFAARAGFSPSTLKRLLQAQAVPKGRRIGHCFYWLEPVIQAYLIKAFDYPLPLPDLPPALMQEVDDAIINLRRLQAQDQRKALH